MNDQETAYSEVEKIVHKFKDTPARERKAMNEQATRLGFILPMFHALGWDTSNINEVSPEEKAAHDEIVKLVEQMLALQKVRQAVRPEDDLDRARSLDKQIESVDEEIDKRVYKLYGVTEDEVTVVEGR